MRYQARNDSCGSLTNLINEKRLHLVFDALDDRKFLISRDAIYTLLQRCIKEKDLLAGKKVYRLMVSNRLDSIPILVDHLIRLFTLCGSLADVNEVFQNVAKPSIYTWNAVIQAHTNLGKGERALELYRLMQKNGVKPEKHTFSSVLKACASTGYLVLGMLIHDQISRSGVEQDVAVGNALIELYAKYGLLDEARRIFDNLSSCNVFSWASLMSGCVKHGHHVISYELFLKMQVEGVHPDKVIFLCVLKNCSNAATIDHGKSIHGQIVKTGLEADIAVSNALIDMYGKCGALKEAKVLFDKLSNRDVITWGSLVSGYVQCGDGPSALEAFADLQKEGFLPDGQIFSSIIKLCKSFGALAMGRLVFMQICVLGLESDVVVGSTLVDMYAECGKLDESKWIFDSLRQHDVVSWGSMINALVEHDDIQSAFDYFDRMLRQGLIPENATVLCIVRACGDRGAAEKIRLVHHEIVRVRLEAENTIGNSVVAAYAKCINLEEALWVFNMLPDRSVVSWGAMITAYAKRGDWKLALKWFEDFQSQGIKSDEVIFLGVLISCSHAGLVSEGQMFFESMQKDHGISPNIEHYNCLVDILGRSGHLEEAADLLKIVPGMDIIGWTSLLTGCETYGNMNVGSQCYEQVTSLDPEHGSGYVLLSNMCSEACA